MVKLLKKEVIFMSKPLIGVIEYPYVDKDNDKMYEASCHVIDYILKNNAIPIGIFPSKTENYQDKRLKDILPLTNLEKDDLIRVVSMCDGIIKPGALKIFEHDRFIYSYALKKNIPYLGICAGMQVMASYAKPRIDNLKIEGNINHRSSDIYSHEIILLDGKLKDILKKDKIMVNSKHSYKVASNGIHRITALSKDGIIEAIENDNCDFNIGVQWHPELLNDENSNLIFNHFVDATNRYKYKKLK